MRHLARPLSLVVLLLVLVAQTPLASASNTWSDTDPLVVIATPAGNQVTVYVDNGTYGTEHAAAAQLAWMTYTVKSVAAGRSTMVALTSIVPCDALSTSYATRTIPSSKPFATGTIYGEAYATCGQPMTVTFTLPVP
jgi:hypothetical protein